MEQDTIHWPQVELSRKTARALWAAMHDDDELVDDYANVCVIHGLNHLLTEVSAEYFTEEAWSRMVQALKEARDEAQQESHELTSRWLLYAEPPF